MTMFKRPTLGFDTTTADVTKMRNARHQPGS
jgi:hypothetical protein